MPSWPSFLPIKLFRVLYRICWEEGERGPEYVYENKGLNSVYRVGMGETRFGFSWRSNWIRLVHLFQSVVAN